MCILWCSGKSEGDDNSESESEGGENTESESEGGENTESESEGDEGDSDNDRSQGGLSSIHFTVQSGDLNQVVILKQQRSLTDKEKLSILEDSFVPPSGYQFPTRIISGCKRHFQSGWLTKYNGLVYSESADGGFCKYCVTFAKCGPKVKELGVLVNKPLTNFKKATEKLDEHFHDKQFHKAAMEAAMLFIKVQKNKSLSIDQQLSNLRRQNVAKNRLVLRSIVEAVILCARQGLALRGHRDDSTHVESAPLANHGNFLALLQFRIRAGDELLKEHPQTAKGNALYTSKTVQNEIIATCGNLIRQKLLKSIRDAGFFSVIADEATDAANQEQLSVSIRFVENNEPCERFMGFIRCATGVTGEAIADNILLQLNAWQLPVTSLRGQAYDGAGSMSGHTKGAAARVSAMFPKALYTHCASHRLNLCIVKSCSNREVTNMMEVVDSISRFFNNSPKRQLELEKWIAAVLPGEKKRRKLKMLCRTRWVERHDAYEVFTDLFVVIVSCLEQIANAPPAEWNRETRSEAQSFLLAVSQFSFIVTLTVTQKILAFTRGLSVKLQGRYVDVCRAHRDIESVKTALKSARSDSQVDTFHEQTFEEAVRLGASVGIEQSSPRLAGRQQHRSNVPAGTVKDYYKLNLTIPLLDHINGELDTRFSSESSAIVVDFMQLLPSTICENSAATVLNKADLTELLQVYEDDLPSARSLDVELSLWHTQWAERDAEQAESLDTAAKVLPHADPDYFPNIRTLFLIMTTLPVTSCECERSISLLRLVKSALRTTMSEDRLNGLTMTQCHRDISLDPEEVVEEFARCHPRRLTLL